MDDTEGNCPACGKALVDCINCGIVDESVLNKHVDTMYGIQTQHSGPTDKWVGYGCQYSEAEFAQAAAERLSAGYYAVRVVKYEIYVVD